MKKVAVIILFIIVFFGLKASAATLIAYYPFEGDANDASGNGYNGTVYGATLTNFGHSGQAYYFDGSNDYIDVPLNINPSNYPQLTMGAWVKADSDVNWGTIISHDDGGFDRTINIKVWNNGSKNWQTYSGSGQFLTGSPVTTN